MKSANPVYMPVGGTVIETNGELANNVQIVNESAENEGWMIKVGNDIYLYLQHHDEFFIITPCTLLSIHYYLYAPLYVSICMYPLL